MIYTIFVLSSALLFCCPAAAASVELVKGKVLINRGNGFQPVTTSTQADVGDQLMAGQGGNRLHRPRGGDGEVRP